MKLLLFFFILIVMSCSQEQTIKQEASLDLSDYNLEAIPDSVFEKKDLVSLNLGNGITFYPSFSALVDSNANHLTKVSEKSVNSLI